MSVSVSSSSGTKQENGDHGNQELKDRKVSGVELVYLDQTTNSNISQRSDKSHIGVFGTLIS